MLIDAIALILLVLAFVKGFRKGLILALFSFFAFVIGLAAALKLSAVASKAIGAHANVSERWLPVLAFAAVFIVVVLLVHVGGRVLESAARLVMLGWLNRLGGFLFYLLIYLFVFSIFLFYALQLHVLKPPTTEASVFYPLIQPVAPAIMKFLAAIFPFLKNIFSDLLQFFDSVSTSSS